MHAVPFPTTPFLAVPKTLLLIATLTMLSGGGTAEIAFGEVSAGEISPGEISAGEISPVSDLIEVQLVEIDVRVIDSSGRPIGGLGKDDFELLIDGEPVAIDFFAAPPQLAAPLEGSAKSPAGGQEMAATEPGRGGGQPSFVIVYADLGLLEPGDLEPMRPQLDAFFERHLPAGSQTMLVLADQTLQVAAPMSRDPEPLRRELAAVDGREDAGQLALAYRGLLRDLRRARSSLEQEIRFNDPLLRAARRDSEEALGNPGVINSPEADTVGADGFLAPQRLARDVQRSLGDDLRRFFGRIETFQRASDNHLLRTSENLRRLSRMVAGLPGRTHVLYLGRRLPTAAPVTLFETWRDETVGLLRDTRSLASEDFEQRQAALDGLEIVEGDIEPFRDGGRLIARAALEAASLGVTLHTIELAGERREFQGGAGEIALGNIEPAAIRRRAAELAALDGLATLAAFTGGRHFDPDSDLPLATLRAELEPGYALGLSLGGSAGDGSSGLHTVEVRLKRPELQLATLHHRRTVEARSLDAQTADRALAALTAGIGGENPIGAEIEVGIGTEATSETEGARQVKAGLAVTLRVPLAGLALIPDGHVHAGRLAVYTSAGGLETGTTAVRRTDLPVRIRNSELLTALGRHIELELWLDSPPAGGGRVAVVIRDEYRPATSTLVADTPTGASSGIGADTPTDTPKDAAADPDAAEVDSPP